MITSGPAAVTASAVCTPLGLTAPAVHAAIRAGIVQNEETSIFGQDGEPLRACRLVLLDTELPRLERMNAMAKLALENIAYQQPVKNLPAVFLSVPPLLDHSEKDQTFFSRGILPMLTDVFPRGVHSMHVFRQGRSGFFFALQAGLAALASASVDSVLVGGIDSLCDDASLVSLDAEGRLLGASPTGELIPSEGAAFVLLERGGWAAIPDKQPTAVVLAAATAREAHHFRQGQPNRGDALTTVFRELYGHTSKRAEVMYTCETGEPFWTEELAMAYLRNGPLMPEPFSRTLQGEAFGDLGAASGAVLMAIGIHALARLARPAPPVLLLCGSSDDGDVGACLMEGVSLVGTRTL